jgi:hypothetical protein
MLRGFYHRTCLLGNSRLNRLNVSEYFYRKGLNSKIKQSSDQNNSFQSFIHKEHAFLENFRVGPFCNIQIIKKNSRFEHNNWKISLK